MVNWRTKRWVFLTLAALVVLTAACDRGVPGASQPPSPQPEASVEHQLAELNCRCPVADDDTTMFRFRFLLQELTTKTGLSRREVAETTLKAQRVAKEDYGKDLLLLDLMEAGRGIVALAPGNPDYGRALASVVAQRVR